MKAILLFSVLLTISGVAYAQEQVTVSSVVVWVRAVDSSGKSVSNLTKDDFEIYEDDKKMSISCFDERLSRVTEVTETASPTQTTATVAATPEQKQKFIFYLDLFNTSMADYSFLKPRMNEFVQQMSNGKNDVMLVALVPSGKLGMISPFTPDMMRISALLGQGRGNPEIDNESRNNETKLVSLLQQLQPEDSQEDDLEDLTRHNTTKDVNSVTLRNAYSVAQQFASQEKSRTVFSLKALASLAQFLSKQNPTDHIVIVYVSGGMNSEPGRRYFELIDQVAQNKGLKSVNSLTYAVRTGGKKEERLDLTQLVKDSIGKINRYNATIYSINTRGMGLLANNTAQNSDLKQNEAEFIHDFQESMHQIALETGGLSFEGSQNFKLGFQQIFGDLSHQYTLCYQPPEHARKDEYHRIRIVSKKPGVQLRHRRGYVD